MCSDPRCSGPIGPADRKHLELVIRRYGWACQGVLDEGPDRPGWSYTIGLSDQRHPEMIIVGMPHDVAYLIFVQVIGEARLGLREWPRKGEEIDGLACGVRRMRVVGVDPQAIRSGDWFRRARQRRAGRFSAIQLVWSEFRVQSSPQQPVLGEVWWN